MEVDNKKKNDVNNSWCGNITNTSIKCNICLF